MGTWTVYVPDRDRPFSFDKSLVATPEEVRRQLINSGITAVGSMNATVEGSVIRFSRATGGTKGVR